MPRVTPLPPDPTANAVVNNPLSRTLGRRPEILDAFVRLDRATRFGGRLSTELKEAARRATACQVGCAYCESLGSVPEDLDPRTALVVRFAREVAADPAGIGEGTFDDLREQFDEEEIVELVAFISLVAVAGQTFGAVMGLEPASPEEAAAYQAVLTRHS